MRSKLICLIAFISAFLVYSSFVPRAFAQYGGNTIFGMVEKNLTSKEDGVLVHLHGNNVAYNADRYSGTNGSGGWIFSNVPSGNYTATVTPPAGWRSCNASSVTVDTPPDHAITFCIQPIPGDPTVTNVVIKDTSGNIVSTVNPNGTQYIITVTTNDPQGGNNIHEAFATINISPPHPAGDERGLIGWASDGVPDSWTSYKDLASNCAVGGGYAAVYTAGYGPQYIDLVPNSSGCSTTVSGTTRTVNFLVSFTAQFTAPRSANRLYGYLQNWQNVRVGWIGPFGSFGLPNRPPIGNNEATINKTCETTGWAFDPDVPAQSITVNVWKGGPAGSGQLIGGYTANVPRGDVNTAYGITGNHGFDIVFNASSGIIDGATHTLYIYGLDSIDPNNNSTLLPPASSGTPLTIKCDRAPTFQSVTISANGNGKRIVSTNAAVQYTITVVANDPDGGSDIGAEYALTNLQDSAGNYGRTDYRGYLGWSATSGWAGSSPYNASFPWWGGSFKAGSPIGCTGGGQGAIALGYGAQYINLVSCTTSVSGTTRTSVFTVTFNPQFLIDGPLFTNQLSGWITDLEGNPVGWVPGDTYDLNQAPTYVSGSFSPKPAQPDGSTPYTITLTSNDANGGDDVDQQLTIINYNTGPNAGLYRGYVSWLAGNWWPGISKDTKLCTGNGGGYGQIYTGPPPPDFGATYMELSGCTSNWSGTQRTTTFTVTFNPKFATDGPQTSNNVDGNAIDWGGLSYNAGWTYMDQFDLAQAISGHVYKADAGGSCASLAPYTNGGATISVDNGSVTTGTGVVDGSGAYKVFDGFPFSPPARHAVLGISGYTLKSVQFQGGAWTNVVGFGYSFNYTANTSLNWCVTDTLPWFQILDPIDIRRRQIIDDMPTGQSIAINPKSICFSSTGTINSGSGTPGCAVVDNEFGYNDDPKTRSGVYSYTFFRNRARVISVPLIDLAADSHVSNCGSAPGCTIANLPTGAYLYNGNLKIGSYTTCPVVTCPNGTHVLILINGTLTINSDMLVGAPGAANLLVLAAKLDATVGSGVGKVYNDVTPDLQEILTSEGSVIFAGTNCSNGVTADGRINFEGAIITNALKPFAIDGAGTFQNNRSLCATNDKNYPVFTLKSRFDFVPQLTDFYKIPSIREREIAP